MTNYNLYFNLKVIDLLIKSIAFFISVTEPFSSNSLYLSVIGAENAGIKFMKRKIIIANFEDFDKNISILYIADF